MRRTQRPLALYLFALFALAAAQIALYIATEFNESLFYFDPRLGLLFFLTPHFGKVEPLHPYTGWLTRGRPTLDRTRTTRPNPTLRTYLIFEALCSVPSLLFILMVLAADMSPSHGFSIGELLIPLPIFVLFSAAPWLYAWRLHAYTPINPAPQETQ